MVASPGRAIAFTILLTIFLGVVLLSLPAATLVPVSLLDLIFTATSATCVTGLMTVPLQSFTMIGQLIIVCLMQIGALGLVTLTVFLISLFVELGLTTQLMAGKVLELESWKISRHIIAFIISLTLAMEFLGTFFVYQVIKADYAPLQAIFYAFFHAVSSFSNAGLTPLADPVTGALPVSMPLLGTTALLVMVGGLGFIVWHEIFAYIRSWSSKKHFHWTLHSKVVLSMTTILIVITTIVIFCLEFLHVSQGSLFRAFGLAFFNAVCCRSTGFTTLDIAAVHQATLFFIMIVAFIGSSPGSTGSGIKTTTFAIFLAAIRAVMSRRSTVELKGRSIPNEQVFKAMAILLLSLSWIAITIFSLLVTDQGWRFIDSMFEAVSAFTNLGLSLGVTPHLSWAGKVTILVTMIVGRIGSLTLLLALKRRQREGKDFHYPEERVILG